TIGTQNLNNSTNDILAAIRRPNGFRINHTSRWETRSLGGSELLTKARHQLSTPLWKSGSETIGFVENSLESTTRFEGGKGRCQRKRRPRGERPKKLILS